MKMRRMKNLHVSRYIILTGVPPFFMYIVTLRMRFHMWEASSLPFFLFLLPSEYNKFQCLCKSSRRVRNIEPFMVKELVKIGGNVYQSSWLSRHTSSSNECRLCRLFMREWHHARVSTQLLHKHGLAWLIKWPFTHTHTIYMHMDTYLYIYIHDLFKKF